MCQYIPAVDKSFSTRYYFRLAEFSAAPASAPTTIGCNDVRLLAATFDRYMAKEDFYADISDAASLARCRSQRLNLAVWHNVLRFAVLPRRRDTDIKRLYDMRY